MFNFARGIHKQREITNRRGEGSPKVKITHDLVCPEIHQRIRIDFNLNLYVIVDNKFKYHD